MEPMTLSYTVDGGDLIGAGEASSQMKLALKKLGIPESALPRIVE